MSRFRCDNLKKLNIGDDVELMRAESNHLFKILRARPGESIRLIDGHGTAGTAVIGKDRKITLESKQEIPFPGRKIHLYVAPPRRQKMDQILKAVTELGVYRIVPMTCDRSVAMPDADSADRQTDLLFEACKQSGNAWLPILEEPVKFSAALAEAKEKLPLNVIGSPYENRSAFENLPDEIGFFVGPEGGFSEAEEQAMRDAGFQPMQVGAWILRVETACIAILSRLL